jgi:hypothetical protein
MQLCHEGQDANPTEQNPPDVTCVVQKVSDPQKGGICPKKRGVTGALDLWRKEKEGKSRWEEKTREKKRSLYEQNIRRVALATLWLHETSL